MAHDPRPTNRPAQVPDDLDTPDKLVSAVAATLLEYGFSVTWLVQEDDQVILGIHRPRHATGDPVLGRVMHREVRMGLVVNNTP
jgi:hypothetical protein